MGLLYMMVKIKYNLIRNYYSKVTKHRKEQDAYEDYEENVAVNGTHSTTYSDK